MIDLSTSGQQFVGSYRMFHLIRAGALYQIWTVRPISETTPFAMKWLPPGPKYTRMAVNGLRHEFQVGSTLDHPSIIRTYEYNTSSNGAYMILELFKVPNLKQQILANHQALKPRAREILLKAAAAVAHLHEHGWVHRDIKPDNFLVNEALDVKMIDFNLTRKKSGMLGKLFSRRGRVQGTYSYIPPEQIRGQALDQKADIYSFGCMVHEVLCGKTPFTANTPNELLQKHMRTRPPLICTIDRNITPEFSAYLQRMMAKEPGERPDSMKEVALELKSQKMFYNAPQDLQEDAQAAEANEN